MLKFYDYLTESADEKEAKGKALKHLTHVEDNVIYGNHEGVGLADAHLQAVHNQLLGSKPERSPVHISTKWDGAPSIVFGHHPSNGKFFVASKSAFNKTPKINYTDQDIENNHGHAPGLVEKLKGALKHLPKIMPDHGGIYQGDLLHTEGDAKTKGNKTSITPNTITYSAPSNSEEGKNMKKKLGIVVHTKYSGGRSLDTMNAGPLDEKTRSKFKAHSDVNNVDPTLRIKPSNYTHEEQKQFLNHMENAKRSYYRIKPEEMDVLKGHEKTLESHVNETVRSNTKPSVEGYMKYIGDRNKKDLESVKSTAMKDKKLQGHAKSLAHVVDNQASFKKILELHNHMQQAKNVLVNVMAKNNPYEHTVGNEKTSPEGAVVVDKKGNMSKFVNRQEFSRQNFLKGAFQKKEKTDAKIH